MGSDTPAEKAKALPCPRCRLTRRGVELIRQLREGGAFDPGHREINGNQARPGSIAPRRPDRCDELKRTERLMNS